MIRMALVVASIAAGLMLTGVSPAAAQESFQSMLEADVQAVETKLQLSGGELSQVDAILQDGVKQRMAVINSLGITPGQKPGFSTLLQLQSQMNAIRTAQHSELSKILTENQMYTVDQMAEDSEQQFRAALLGS